MRGLWQIENAAGPLRGQASINHRAGVLGTRGAPNPLPGGCASKTPVPHRPLRPASAHLQGCARNRGSSEQTRAGQEVFSTLPALGVHGPFISLPGTPLLHRPLPGLLLKESPPFYLD